MQLETQRAVVTEGAGCGHLGTTALVGADAPGRGDGDLLNLKMRRILHRFFELEILIKGVDGCAPQKHSFSP
jgi:hypothetical protein